MIGLWLRLMVLLGRRPHVDICNYEGHRWEAAWDRCSRCGMTGMDVAMRSRS